MTARKAQHFILAGLRNRDDFVIDVLDPCFNRRVVSRPLERSLVARTAGVNLNPVELVLQAVVSRGWRQQAHVLVIWRGLGSRVQSACAQRGGVVELSQRTLASHIARRARGQQPKQLDLINSLKTSRRIGSAERDFPDQFVVQRGDLSQPRVEKHEISSVIEAQLQRAARRTRRRAGDRRGELGIRKVRLTGVGRRLIQLA